MGRGPQVRGPTNLMGFYWFWVEEDEWSVRNAQNRIHCNITVIYMTLQTQYKLIAIQTAKHRARHAMDLYIPC